MEIHVRNEDGRAYLLRTRFVTCLPVLGTALMKWVIAYDVREDRQRQRLAKRLEQLGFRRQKSVFEGELSPREVSRLLDELLLLLDPEHDSLTAWPTADNGTAVLQHRGTARGVVQKDWLVL